jgi:hypothetical protein
MAWGMVPGLGKIRDAGMFALQGRHTSGATAALVRYCENGVEIVLGHPANTVQGIRKLSQEIVTFQDAPELRNLWSLAGWRMREVDALLSDGLEDRVLVMSPRAGAEKVVTLVNGSPA